MCEEIKKDNRITLWVAILCPVIMGAFFFLITDRESACLFTFLAFGGSGLFFVDNYK
jgi:hypothetical protein